MAEIIFDENEDWGKRILCSDESCIGTIGPDGKCKECGKAYEGEFKLSRNDKTVKTIKSNEQKEVSVASEKDEWDNRVLCSDESCIGVIGPDGKCKECGKPL